ncbi:phage portal protein [Rhodopirellula halodulae]|uniref:phage portal protein n=1 Tax=Rhodopirellula halodulae TaxID=2894198 RepID=UPI001E3DE328|nr:phage portal protein [Rhodopirellula sp. JC737]MCC9655292.1 phage portal protein [Rhodopirellula sp. JC737]
MTRRRNTISLLNAFNDAKADYDAAKENRYVPRLSGVDPAGSGHSYHIRNEREFLKIIERSRDLERNDLIIGSALKRLVANIVQDGFSLDPQTGDNGLDEDIKAKFQDWGSDPDQCHSEGELDFHTIERLTLLSILRDGDMIHLPLKSGALQCVEAHRLRTPTNTTRNVVHGVMMNKKAQRTEYWISKEDLGLRETLQRVTDVQRYPARDSQGNRAVFHCYLPDRFSQRRGISALAPVVIPAGIHGDLQFSALVKQQVASLIAIFREQAAGTEDLPFDTPLGPTTEVSEDGSIREIEGLAAGLDITGRPGQKLQGFSPNIPSPQYFEHVMMILRFIGANLDLPAAVMLLDPSDSNFSSWRGSIDQARIRFRQFQCDLRQKFHSPVYKWKMRQWLASDSALQRAAKRGGIEIFRHVWNPPSWAYIEPLTDAKADDWQQQALLNSPRRIQAARGRDYTTVASEIVEDNKLMLMKALEAAADLNRQFPEANITWREMLSLSQKDRLSFDSEPEPVAIAAQSGR